MEGNTRNGQGSQHGVVSFERDKTMLTACR